MQTTRLSVLLTSPSTEYYHGADLVAQSQSGNYSVVRVSATAINRGGTSSFDGGQGAHTAAIDGYGQAQRTGTIPSGVGVNVTRWNVTLDVTLAHDGNGNLGTAILRHTVSGWHPTHVNTAEFGGFPRIPKAPSAPGTPIFTEVLPTSVRVSWSASADNAGSAITGYLLRYWANAAGTGPFVDVSSTNDLSRVVTGLTPGQEYRFVVYAINGSHAVFSVASAASVIRTLSGLWCRWLGVWRRTVPFVNVSGIWRPVSVFTRHLGVWRRGG